jgi:hypothetical protein
MPIQTIEPRHHTVQSETFASRKAILAALTASQAKEHAYYAAAADTVGKHMRDLCTEWTAILRNQILGGTAAVLDRFSRTSGIRLDQLHAWRAAHRGYEHAQAEQIDAQNELAAAEQTRSQFAGRLWGAKKGFEQEYAARDDIVKRAKVNLEHERTTVDKAERTLDALSEALLRDCVGKSAVVSASPEFGLEIGRILRAMQTQGQTLERQHNEDQLKLLESAGSALRALVHHY